MRFVKTEFDLLKRKEKAQQTEMTYHKLAFGQFQKYKVKEEV